MTWRQNKMSRPATRSRVTLKIDEFSEQHDSTRRQTAPFSAHLPSNRTDGPFTERRFKSTKDVPAGSTIGTSSRHIAKTFTELIPRNFVILIERASMTRGRSNSAGRCTTLAQLCTSQHQGIVS